MMNHFNLRQIAMAGCCVLTALITATTAHSQTGDEIIVCGERFHTGVPIVLWTDQGGYDFHYTKAPVGTPEERKPTRVRQSPLTDEQIAHVRSEGWTPELLRSNVDQFVIHYSVDPTSRDTFNTLVKRHLAVQFMLDLDGTIYQTMDAQEEAAHATKANGRSVGIEIANLGARLGSDVAQLNEWYKRDATGQTVIQVPTQLTDKDGHTTPYTSGIRTKDFHGRPARPQLIKAIVQGKLYEQYDLTPEQYKALTHLTAALCTAFPKITCDYPRQKPAFGAPSGQIIKTGPAAQPAALATMNEPGALIPHVLTTEQYDVYQGILGHYHVQLDKQDPGPAFQWNTVIGGARKLMTPQALAANAASRGKPARFIPSVPAPKNAAK